MMTSFEEKNTNPNEISDAPIMLDFIRLDDGKKVGNLNLRYRPESIMVKVIGHDLMGTLQVILTTFDGKMVGFKCGVFKDYPQTPERERQAQGLEIQDPTRFWSGLQKEVAKAWNRWDTSSRERYHSRIKEPEVNTEDPLIRELTTPPIRVPLAEIYRYVGKRIMTEGRITNTDCGITNDGKHRHLTFRIKEDKTEILAMGELPPTFVEWKIPIDSISNNDPLSETYDFGPCGLVSVIGTVKIRRVKDVENETSKCIIEADTVEETDLEFHSYNPSKEDQVEIEKYFGSAVKPVITNENIIEKMGGTIAIQVAKRDYEKTLAALTALVPLYLPYEGGVFFGFRCLFGGDTQEAKSKIGRDLVFNLLPRGARYVSAESARITGLTATVVQDKKTGRWTANAGILSQADKCFVFLDASQALDSEVISNLREGFSSGEYTITKAYMGKRPMRIRMLWSGNTPYDMSIYDTNLEGMRHIGVGEEQITFKEKADWLRIALCVPFCKEHVSLRESDDRLQKSVGEERLIPAEVFKKLVMTAWKRGLDDYVQQPDVEPFMNATLDKWSEEYEYVEMALFSRIRIHVFLSLTYAVATIKNRLDEKNRVVVTVEDAECVKMLCEKMFERLGLEEECRLEAEKEGWVNALADPNDPIWKDLSSREIEAMTTIRNAVAILFKNEDRNRTIAKDLAATMGMDRNTLFARRAVALGVIEKRLVSKLKKNRTVPPFLESRQGRGWYLTEYGRRFGKRMKEIGVDFIGQSTLPLENGQIKVDNRPAVSTIWRLKIPKKKVEKADEPYEPQYVEEEEEVEQEPISDGPIAPIYELKVSKQKKDDDVKGTDKKTVETKTGGT